MRAIFLLVFAVAASSASVVAQSTACPGCPITSISASVGALNKGKYLDLSEDDFFPLTVTVNHRACVSVDSQFTVEYNSTVYGPFNYSAGTVTYATINLFKRNGSGKLTVVDDYQCSKSQNVTMPRDEAALKPKEDDAPAAH